MKPLRDFLQDVLLAVLIGLVLAVVLGDWAADDNSPIPPTTGSPE